MSRRPDGGRTRRFATAVLLATAAGACSDDFTRSRDRLVLAAQWEAPTAPILATGLADSVRVAVTDAAGRPREDVRVVFVVTEGDGTLSARVVRSDAAGLAASRWTLGLNSGLQRVRAFTPDDARGEFVDFDVTVVAGPAVSVSLRIPSRGIGLGDSSASVATFRDEAGVTVPAPVALTYESADTSIATVSSTGVVRGVSYGRTVITASAGAFVASDTAIVRVPVPTLVVQPFASARPTYLPAFTPGGIAYLPAVAGDRIGRFDVATTSAFGAELELPAATLEVATSADASVVVASSYLNGLFVINPGSFTVTRTIPLADRPVRLKMNAAGTLVYATYLGGGVARVDLTTDSVTNLVLPGPDVNGIALSPDEATLYVSSTAGYLYRISTASFTVTHSATPGQRPQGLAVSPDGATLYLARESGTALRYNAADLTFPVELPGTSFFDIAATPDGRYILAARASAGLIVIFDAVALLEVASSQQMYPVRRFARDPLTGTYWAGSESQVLYRLTF